MTEAGLTRSRIAATLSAESHGNRDSLGSRLVADFVHFFAYHFVLARGGHRNVSAAGFRLEVAPPDFDPRIFRVSEFFARFVLALDLRGKRVADVGTGTGILALAAARAGASEVVALDINPAAVRAAEQNAARNHLAERIVAVQSDLLAALPPRPTFDVIISDPPPFPGEPRDMADRAWHAGPGYRDVVNLFAQAKSRLVPGGVMYLSLSHHSDLKLLGKLIADGGFQSRLAAEHSIWIDRLLLFELRQAAANEQPA